MSICAILRNEKLGMAADVKANKNFQSKLRRPFDLSCID